MINESLLFATKEELKKLEEKITTIIVSESEPVQSCIWYKIISSQNEDDTNEILIQTKEYDENETYHLEQDNNLETIINMTDSTTDNENIIVEEIEP